jgi:hypothetical protein
VEGQHGRRADCYGDQTSQDFRNNTKKIAAEGSEKLRTKSVVEETVQLGFDTVGETNAMVQVDRPVVRMFSQHFITVRWETRFVERRGLELKVLGPGTLRRSHSFQDALSLVEYQLEFERQLLSNGYGVLPHSERRSGNDRRRQPRTAEDRRKQ